MRTALFKVRGLCCQAHRARHRGDQAVQEYHAAEYAKDGFSILTKARRVFEQTKAKAIKGGLPKLYSWHAPEVHCFSKGKARTEQATILMQDTGEKPSTAVVDLGYRGVDRDNPDLRIIHRGKAKSLGGPERKLIKRRNAVEPVIGHLKADHRMDRCHLRGEIGDRLHTVLCAAGYNLRWLCRAIARKGLGAFFWLLPPELAWAIRRHLADSFLRISPAQDHEMAPN